MDCLGYIGNKQDSRNGPVRVCLKHQWPFDENRKDKRKLLFQKIFDKKFDNFLKYRSWLVSISRYSWH